MKKSDGSYQLTYKDGQTVDFPDIDMDRLAELKGLAGLEGLENLEGLAALEGLDGLAALKGLEELDGLKLLRSITSVESLDGLEKLEKLKSVGMVDGDVRVVTLHGSDSKAFEAFPEKLRETLGVKDGTKLKIIRNRDGVRWVTEEDGETVELDDTVVSTRSVFFRSSDPLESAQDQLEQTKRQLEKLSANESVSYDLQNALRDIESAQRSLEEAGSRLLDESE